ncbi:hypothetical protein AIW12_25125 [Salmonella enterica]|nr:hypothetical protein [Salmonella enterica]
MNKICLALLVMVFSGSALAATNTTKKTAPVNVLDASKLTTPKTLGYVDPLRGYTRTLFPDDAKTVREAVVYLLEPTGYRLITHGAAPYDSNALVDRAIPVSAKIVRTVPVIDALQILIGTENTIIIDPAHKLVSFEKGVRTK